MRPRLAALLLAGVVAAAGSVFGQALSPQIPPPQPSNVPTTGPAVRPPNGPQSSPPASGRTVGPEDAEGVRALCRVAPDWRVFPLCHRLRETN
jgi:hypothetical protein